ncbi:MAG: transglutaminase domain-containing protein [Chitinophagaceae bacterium]
MFSVKLPLAALCIAFTMAANAQSSNNGDYAASIPAFKTKYPKTDIVAVTYKEEYNFSIGNTGKVAAGMAVSQTLVPLKDFISSYQAVFYDDESQVEALKASSQKTRNIKLVLQCSDYQSEGIFHSDAKMCKIAIPLEERGVPVSFSYEKKYKDVKYLTSVYFHESVPVEEKTVVFNVPDWLEVEMREFNFEGYKISKKVEKDASGKNTVYTYQVKNIQALEDEYRAPNIARSYPHIVVVGKGFTDKGQRTVLFESVKDLYAWYHSLRLQVSNNQADLKPLVTQLTAGKKTDVEKIEAIYYWVQDKIRYIAFENGVMGFKPDAAQNVFKNKYGDCKGKANLLTEMLRVAGFDARLTWIGTADLPYDYTLPSLAVDNHMISTVILGGKRYFLDGTEEHIAFNDYAHRIQGKQVLIEDGEKYLLDRIPEFGADRNKVEAKLKLKLEGDAITGTNTTVYNGESKIGLVSAFESLRNDNKTDAFSSYLRNDDANLLVSNIKNPQWDDRQKPLEVSFDVKANHQVTKAGNELYCVLEWRKELNTLKFDSTRKNDYEFSSKLFYTTQTEFTVPDGYKIDYLPDAVTIKKEAYSFEGSYTSAGNVITYNKKLIINNPIIRKTDFTAWNEFIGTVDKFYAEQVVLVKK